MHGQHFGEAAFTASLSFIAVAPELVAPVARV
jgi:hypothetical protein